MAERVVSSGARDLDFITGNPAFEAYNEGQKIAQERDTRDLAIEHAIVQNAEQSAGAPTRLRKLTADTDTSRATANVAARTVESKVSKAASDARSGTSNANVMVATEGDRIASAKTRLRRDEAGLVHDQIQNMGKVLELANKGLIDEARMVAQQSGQKIPDEVLTNAGLRAHYTEAWEKAQKIFPNRPQDQMTFMQALVGDRLKRQQEGNPAPPNDPAALYTVPGAPTPQEDTTRDKFTPLVTQEVDPNDPTKTLTRNWNHSSSTGEVTPIEGPKGALTRATGSGAGGAGRDPANVATAKWLVDKGIATSPSEAWTMVNTSKSNPAAMDAQIYNAALKANYGDIAKAKRAVEEWRAFNATAPAATAPSVVRPPVAPPGPAPAPAVAPASPAPAAPIQPAPRNPADRVVGTTYLSPDGRKGEWTRQGWKVAP